MNETGREHTGANYRTALQRLLEFAPKVQFQDITVAFLNKYETFLSQKMGQRGVQLYMSCLRRLYNMAIDSFNADGIERIKHSPFEHYSIPTPPETQKRSLTKEQIRLVADFETTDNKVDLPTFGLPTMAIFGRVSSSSSPLLFGKSSVTWSSISPKPSKEAADTGIGSPRPRL